MLHIQFYIDMDCAERVHIHNNCQHSIQSSRRLRTFADWIKSTECTRRNERNAYNVDERHRVAEKGHGERQHPTGVAAMPPYVRVEVDVFELVPVAQ